MMSVSNQLAILALAICVAAPVATKAGTLTTIYTFTGGTDGGNVYGALTYINGELYGTTPYKGSSGNGNVFKVNAATGKFEVVHAFQGGTDGAAPGSGVIYQDGLLYGTTVAGGGSGCTVSYPVGCGTIFSINPKTKVESILYSFSQDPNGSKSGAGALVYLGGLVYGTTSAEGENNDGSVFSFNLATGSFATLYSFSGDKDGAEPNVSLQYANGLLYGTTVYGGGQCNCGTVFAVNPSTGADTLLHAFSTFADGVYPLSNLIYYAGSLQGDTGRGGISPPCKYGCGVSFAINAESGAETILDTFSNRKATYAALTLKGEAVYETLGEGGGHGKLIKADLKSGKTTTMYRFTSGTDGDNPEAPLIYHDGAFYGSTTSGGAHGYGTIFKYVP